MLFRSHSIANRMFADAKRVNELFPDAFDPNIDTKSLTYRLKTSEERSNAELAEPLGSVIIAEANEG